MLLYWSSDRIHTKTEAANTHTHTHTQIGKPLQSIDAHSQKQQLTDTRTHK